MANTLGDPGSALNVMSGVNGPTSSGSDGSCCGMGFTALFVDDRLLPFGATWSRTFSTIVLALGRRFAGGFLIALDFVEIKAAVVLTGFAFAGFFRAFFVTVGGFRFAIVDGCVHTDAE